MARLPILSGTAALEAAARSLPRTCLKSYASYSSVLGGIVRDPALMTVPLDDHGFHRGHAVFDTCNVADGRAFGLGFHLDRLLASAQQARIFGGNAEKAAGFEKETLRSLVLSTIAATGRRNGLFVRYWLTAGRGDFAISPTKCEGAPNFYVVAHEDTHSAEVPRGYAAAVVPVPLKPPLLATMKSNNYLLNALVALEAEARGVQIGLQIDDDGFVAESAVSLVTAVTTDGLLLAPPPTGILPSTTWRRVQALAPSLVDSGLITGCEERRLRLDDLLGARELINMGGGWVEPILTLDGKPVGSGGGGPVWRALDETVRADFLNPALTDAIPYDDYE